MPSAEVLDADSLATEPREAARMSGGCNAPTSAQVRAAIAAAQAEAVATYGSATGARQWVLPAQDSEHVTGGAVDTGPAEGLVWLRTNGVRFGLCQRHANEPWHVERLAGGRGSDCPAPQAHP